MNKKIVGIFICVLLITTCVIPVCSRMIDSNIKKSLDPTVTLYNDYLQTPLYKRSLQDIISGKQLPSLTGTRPLMVILTNFINKNMDSNHDVDYFTDMMWGPRPSLSDYFSEVSYGKFTYSQAGILGWYKTDFTQSQMESNPLQFFTEVIAAADEDFNYSTYDTNNDGLVTNEELTLMIVYPKDVWRASSWHYSLENEIKTKDGVSLEGEFSIHSEWSPLGIFAHELGHDLGLPDLYDLGWDSNGIGCYGLMGYGCWCGPTHMTAWSKIQLGWLTPTFITINGTYTLKDVETYPEALILCDLTHSAFEYFLIENRYRGTSYDSIDIGEWWSPNYIFESFNLTDEGILIYHIDDSKASDWWNKGLNNVNAIEEHKGVDVECSDSSSSHIKNADDLDSCNNYGDATDLWDITTYDFDDFSIPCNTIWYDGTPSGCVIRDFSAAGSIMTMNISMSSNVENHPPNKPTITGETNGQINVEYTYTTSSIDLDEHQVAYYVDWGDETNSGWTSFYDSGEVVSLKHTWIVIDTYEIKVKAKDTYGDESDWATFEVTMPKTHNYNSIIDLLLEMSERFLWRTLGSQHNIMNLS